MDEATTGTENRQAVRRAGGRARGRVRVEPSPKRVRALVDGVVVADTRSALLVWEKPYYPTYYVPRADVRAELSDTGRVERSPSRGDGHVLDVSVAGRTVPDAALAYPGSPLPELRDAVRLDWEAMDEWLEEDEPVYVHPRDPYTRVDVLASSRHVRIELDGVELADSDQPRILFETGLPPRYYLPMGDVRLELLRRADTVSRCPYKGVADWWSVVLPGAQGGEPREHADLAWCYRSPLPESQKVAGLVAFYDEKVDVFLDGELQERPVTPFS
ncbi:DUF427 domain-containing protein [Motilibacter aurantiacus]|uniref:DUF427 domain-containing protein n=1 Tax=Motilibacter aurantiacus TaxID=2714955 RepID=UPI00140C896A|nr:DUF427 domain-containing protein [Motilibacter aurantiacus]NHC43776.1 DUF427 domain-containing protein [Motilibacter aurantiacus]